MVSRPPPVVKPVSSIVAPRLGEPTVDVPEIDFHFDNYYDVLGVNQSASSKQMAEAAFEQVKIYDRRAKRGDEDANERMTLINRAKDTLTNANKRREYDRRPGTLFLALRDPGCLPRLDWQEGLRLIDESLESPGLIERASYADFPNSILDQLLR